MKTEPDDVEWMDVTPNQHGDWMDVTPNQHGDWINQRSDDYLKLRPVAIIQSEDTLPSLPPLFQSSSFGITSRRDAWVFNSRDDKLREMVKRQVTFYNEQVNALNSGANAVVRDPKRFKWDLAAERRAKRGFTAEVQVSGFRTAVYRPFFRQHYYMERVLTSALSLIPSYFPAPDIRYPSILIERGLRTPGRSPTVIAVNTVAEGAMAGASGQRCQVLPRYVYDEPPTEDQGSLIPVERRRRDNITDDALAAYRARYGEWVTKDYIFDYIYGLLHSPEYRAHYANDLARLLPRIPEVSTTGAFRAFSEVGRKLLDLHINYERADVYPLDEQVSLSAPTEPERYRVQKMRWGGTTRNPDRSAIVYNDWITLAGIPDEAHEYVVGPRSALEWLIDRYRVTQDRNSGIVNDPNDWGREIGDSRYILDLVKRIVTVSVETVKIVKSLPPLEEA